MADNTVVIYNSKTGFTKRYAEWISKELGCECLKLDDAKNRELDEFDTIIFGGWACAGTVSKLK